MISEQYKTYRSSNGRILAGIFVRTFFLFLFLWILRDFSSFLLSDNDFIYGLTEILTLPVLLAVSTIFVLLYLLPKRTRIRISKTQMEICQGMHHLHIFPLTSCEISPHKKIRNGCLKRESFYLKIQKRNGKPILYKLPFFSKNTYTALISAIHAAGTHAIPAELRSEMAYQDLQEGELTYRMPISQIRTAEWKRFALFSAVILIVSVVMFFLRKEYVLPIEYLFLILSVILPVSIPIEAVRIIRNLARCPKTIRRHGTFLFMDDTCFSVSRISKIVMTDRRAVSKSIYPLNRYIKIVMDGKQHIYWAGSVGALSDSEYAELCDGIERIFLSLPDKVYYEQN